MNQQSSHQDKSIIKLELPLHEMLVFYSRYGLKFKGCIGRIVIHFEISKCQEPPNVSTNHISGSMTKTA